MINTSELGIESEIAREDAMLLANGINADGTVPERVAPLLEEAIPIDAESVRSVRGFSLTAVAEEFPIVEALPTS